MLFKKRLIASILSFLLIFTLSSVPAEAAELKEGDTVSFQILFTSDTHGSFTNYNYATGRETIGGLTKIASLIKQEKAAFSGKTFVFDVGDTIQGNGTSYFINNNQFKPFPNVAAFNTIGYDIAVPGNHEFNFGLNALYESYNGFQGKKLAANVTYNDGTYLKDYAPYHIFTLEEGLRIAVIGVVTPNIERWDAGNMKKDGTKAENAAIATKRVLDELKQNNRADVFVLAAHMGESGEYDREGSGALDVAKANPDLAVILGAHHHTIVGAKDKQHTLGDTGIKFVENRNAAASLGKVIITAVYENGKWVVKNKSGSYDNTDVKTDVIEVKENTPKDPDAEAAILKAHNTVKDYVEKTVVGKLVGGPLVPEPEIKGTYEGYLKDTALSDLINNTMLHFTGADISGTAPLDRQSNHQPGDITVAGVVKIYKFDNNTLYTLKMTGAQVIKWMEWSYSYFGSVIDGVGDNTKPAVNLKTDLTIPSGVLRDYNQDQFAGIIYEVDLTKPVGKRIHVVSMADGTPFNKSKEYVVAANDYRSSTQLLSNSKDGVFKPGEKTAELMQADIPSPKGNTSMMDLIIEYISAQPDKTLTNQCDNNWKFVNLDWDAKLRAKAIQAINEGLIQTDFLTPVTKEQVLALDAAEEVTEEKEDEEKTEEQEENNNTKEENVILVKKYHHVEKGDNLSKIALAHYNDASLWRRIYTANKSIIKNPNIIQIGQKLLIP